MDKPVIFRILLTAVFIFILFPEVRAGLPVKKEAIAIAHVLQNKVVLLTDTNRFQRQDEKKEKKEKSDEKTANKQEPNKPEIREVPKARKQSRPPVVVKPNIKVKTIKVIRPNIKRP